MNPHELFFEPTLKQITTWSRGVILIKDGRDVSFLLGEGGRADGKYVQAYENYVDLPDRVNVPVTSFARIADEPIESKFLYENSAHDVVVVLEESLVRSPILNNIINGATLVVNTRRSAEEIAKFLPKHPHLKQIVTVDASKEGRAEFTLSGQEGATDATGIGGGYAGPLAGAVAKATGLVTLQGLMKVAKNPKAVEYGFNTCIIADAQAIFKKGIGKEFTGDVTVGTVFEVPFAGTVKAPVDRNFGMVTNTWRIERPVLTEELCTQCQICMLNCPDACIKLTSNAVEVDYDFCKGCGLCTATCPTNAFKDVPELDFVS
ncbi:MAG TPA: 4Fe-4S binding protein [Symbiobacteriaceae bacterium]|nr:4Fe-4S binding protein [Symbiobacteriaceae bacterium]